jgi:ABC-type Fe3+-hydroxamate transport system substrate-binding protein
MAWGLVPVACTRFCERPELPHVGGTKDPDLAEITRLRPDLVVMCEEENLLAHHDELVAAGLDTFTFHVDAVSDVAPQLAALAGVVGVPFAGFDLPPAPTGPVARRAFVPIWRRPWMTLSASTYGSSLLARLGIANAFADAVVRYPEVTLEEAAARHPDVVLLPTEPYPFKERHRAEVASVAPAVLVDGQDLFWWGTRTPAALARLGDLLGPGVPG